MRAWCGLLVLAATAASCGPGSAGPEPDAGAGGSDAGVGSDAAASSDGAPGADAAIACPGDTTLPNPASCAALGVVIDPFYAARYSCFDLGAVPGVPPQKYGGLTLRPGSCQSQLLIGGEANDITGKLYAITVRRDGRGHIGGFSGSATALPFDAAYNDGGVVFGPTGALFLARYPSNQLGMVAAGGSTTKIVDLSALGVASSPGGMNFVPTGFGGAGALKLVSWPGGEWYTLTLSPDTSGTFDITAATPAMALTGGPEGFTYVKAGSPNFSADSLLVSEWSANSIATYESDASGNPVLATRRSFLTGLTGAEGAYRDPDTGDFFFSTWSSGVDRVIVVRGFLPIID